MGHKVHPYGFRLGITSRGWPSGTPIKDYTTLLQEDIGSASWSTQQLANASVSQVEIERGINHVTVTVHTAKPGIVIGKGGANVELLRRDRQADRREGQARDQGDPPARAGRRAGGPEHRRPAERRIAFRKAVKQAVQRTIKAGAKGVKIQVSGSPRRRRDGPPRVGQGRPHPARNAARRHQLRRGPRPHDLRPDRRQGLGLPRRHRARAHARPRRRRAGRRPGRGPEPCCFPSASSTARSCAAGCRRGQGRPHRRLRRVRAGPRRRPGSPAARSRRPAER